MIHILGNANQALVQLSASTYEWTIVRAMQQGIMRQCMIQAQRNE